MFIQTTRLLISILVISGLFQGVRPSNLDSEDARRALHKVPSSKFIANDATHVPSVLNRFITLHAERFDHQAASCQSLNPKELEAVLLVLLEISFSDSESKLLQRHYISTKDQRQLPYWDLNEAKRLLQQQNEILSTLEGLEQQTVAEAVHAGRCYEAVLIYIHHLSVKAKQSLQLSRHRIPLLPPKEVVERVFFWLNQSNSSVSHTSKLHQLVSKVGDQVVCTRCHVLPNSSFVPNQNTYISTAIQHQPLNQIPQKSSTNGSLTVDLHVSVGRVEGPLSFNARLYNGQMPGPTLRVKPGDVLTVNLINDLSTPLSCQADRSGAGPDTNLYRCPNVTNIHLHGLWVEPHDVYSGVFPGETKTYKFNIPSDHIGGTHWYHPHFHGSVSLQLAGGMAGLVIVEDNDDDIDPALASLSEQTILLQSIEYFNYTMDDILCPHSNNLSKCHNLDGAGSISTIQRFSNDKLPLDITVNDARAGHPIGGVYFMVNGQYQPVISLRPGEWQRWRVVNAAHQSSISLALPGCSVKVIAMDGVYLKAPRPKNSSKPLVLVPGARGDVIVMCNTVGQYLFRSFENPDLRNYGQQEGFNSGVLALVNVSGAPLSMKEPTTLPSLPPYLEDTLHASSSSEYRVQWDLIQLINNTAGLTDVPIYGIDGHPFNSSLDDSLCVTVSNGSNEVAEWSIVNPIWICNASVSKCLTTMDRDAASGSLLGNYQEPITLSHGFHMHTYKFQVVADSNYGVSTDYEIGDWRDTIMTPVAGWVKVRWRPNFHYQGLIPFHCHMSPHSDRGMIATAQVKETCESHINLPSDAKQQTKDSWEPRLTNYTFPITTTSQRAQHLFDEGLQLCFGFEHDAALRFFNMSIQEDSQCAMCYWGLAYAYGPVINVPICGSAACDGGFNASSKAQALASSQELSKKEQFLIQAMSLRYSNDANANMTHHFRMYAEFLNTSMTLTDPDMAAFFAEAVMMIHAEIGRYNFYDNNTQPIPEIRQAISVLEAALKLPTPGLGGKHPFVEHLYMHITEPSLSGFGPNSAGRSFDAANDVLKRFNGTQWQHMQHMSGHIYLRVGRYGDVVTVNQIAHESDAIWLQEGYLPYGPGHNLAFLIYGACMDGQSDTAYRYGQTLLQVYKDAPDRPDGPGPDLGWNIPLTSYVRFGKWSEVLASKTAFDMPRDWPYQRVMAYYSFGIAQVKLNQIPEANTSLMHLQSISKNLTGRYLTYAQVANLTLSSVVAFYSNDSESAVAFMTNASAQQASWPYDEPPDFHMPLAQCLGQLYLQLKNYPEAEQAFKSDLMEYIDNGWSLYGLIQAMKNQPSKYQPSDWQPYQEKLEHVWQRADVTLTSSCLAFSS